MGIPEEIFSEFFKKLEQDSNFPLPIVVQLKKLWQSGDIASQDNLLEAIKRAEKDVNKGKVN